jgi:hypothetical protein
MQHKRTNWCGVCECAGLGGLYQQRQGRVQRGLYESMSNRHIKAHMSSSVPTPALPRSARAISPRVGHVSLSCPVLVPVPLRIAVCAGLGLPLGLRGGDPPDA